MSKTLNIAKNGRKTSKTFAISETADQRIQEIAKRLNRSASSVVDDLILAMPLPKKKRRPIGPKLVQRELF